ncbi:fibroleukin-like [Haliotis cracherodii]|uniref:fibroleukin-like n=1 Tax=Haliotis cracherodii TaxID=6455 RepID=UPI0039EA474D
MEVIHYEAKTVFFEGFRRGSELYVLFSWRLVVIQKRRDGSVWFNRTSAEYTDGFGDLKTEFWLGDSFRDADGEQFSTEDDDRDDKLLDNCAKKYFGGWWYNACGGSCLNGLYTASNGRGIFWKDWRGAPIKVTEMKIRSLERVKDCVGLPKNKGGAYMVNPDDLHPFPAYCDTTTEGGNWLVIQRRKSGTVNFFRTWSDYARGFGDTEGEFWIGNNVLNRLTKSGNTVLRIDLEDPAGEKWYAIYRHFKVASEAEYFKLSIGIYSGNAGDSLRYHDGREFSTKDRDRDRHRLVNCAVKHTGAWWYNACHLSNLNGQYNITSIYNLGRGVYSRDQAPANVAEPRVALQAGWRAISRDTIRKFIISMPPRFVHLSPNMVDKPDIDLLARN